MAEFSFTLISDGSSDRALNPVLKWVLIQAGLRAPIRDQWIEWGRFRNPPRSLDEKIKAALHLYPCDLLFIHRDAETLRYDERKREILNAVQQAGLADPPRVCIVPVRMMEAWFLFDEHIIREASGNPHGRDALRLPPLDSLESLPDPKAALHELLREASGLLGRRRRRFRVAAAIHRMADILQDYRPLRRLPAFGALEADVRMVLCERGSQSTPV